MEDSMLPTLSVLSSSDLIASLDEHEGSLVDWINELIDDNEAKINDEEEEGTSISKPVDLTDLDKRVGEISTRLDGALQDTSSQLELTIEDISRNVPRLTYDLQLMRESALTLQLALNHIHERVVPSVTADEEVTKALEQLKLLDITKKNMESARSILQEAENWSTLESEVTSLLKEGEDSYGKAAERLAEARASMGIFQNASEYEVRRNLMVNLQNQLEAGLSSALVAAINALDISKCKKFYSVFKQIEREHEFRNYYFGTRRSNLVALWHDVALSDVGSVDEVAKKQSDEIARRDRHQSLRFTELFGSFLIEFLTLVEEEGTYTPSIFTSEPQVTISLFVQTTLEALNPALGQRLNGLVEFYVPKALPELIKTFQLAEEFAVSVEKVMDKLRIAMAILSPPPATASEEGGHARKQSKRMSMSRRIAPQHHHRTSINILPTNLNHVAATPWEQALFEPFIDFQSDYPRLEKQYLEAGLSLIYERSRVGGVNRAASPLPSSSGDAEQTIRGFRERALDVFALADTSLGRCMSFTHGYGAAGAVKAVDHLFREFLNREQDTLLISKTIGGNDLRRSSLSFDDTLLTPEDLNSFQLALNLLNASRLLWERLLQLESRFKAAIMQLSSAFRIPSTHHGVSFPTSEHPSLASTSRGEADLLAQSALNSFELQSLLDKVDPQSIPTASVNLSHIASTPLTSTFLATPTSSSTLSPILEGSRSAFTDFARATQIFLQRTILAPLYKDFSLYPSLSVWTGAETKKRAPHELAVPIFSLSATPTMQSVCEGLMALPRLFEDYGADDDALSFSLETLPFVDADPGLKELLSPPIVEHEPMLSPSRRRLSLSASAPVSPKAIRSSASLTITSEMISSAWLTSITLTLLSHLTSKVLPLIRTLSVAGATQLAYDLGNLANIARALNAEWEPLEKWREYCELSQEEGKKKFMTSLGAGAFAASVKGGENADAYEDEILSLVAKIRGWSV